MKKNYTKILIFIALAMYQITASAAPPPKDVNVINTPDVNVVNMPPVEVTVPGALDVNVQNTPGVTIENGPLEPVPVTIDSYPREPVTIQVIFDIESNGGNPPQQNFYTVPSDKILVLQHVSINKGARGTSYIDYAFIRSLNVAVTNRLYFVPQITASGTSLVSQQVTQYFPPNAELWGGLYLTAANTPAQVNALFTLTGYLVPVGSPSLGP